MQKLRLEKQGLVLRTPSSLDLDWIKQACNDEDIAKWIPQIPHPYTSKDAVNFILQTVSMRDQNKGEPFVIEDENGKRLGMITLHLARHGNPKIAEVGYWVAKDSRGKGFATRALKAVLCYAAKDKGIVRIELLCDPENKSSAHVAKSAGFMEEGTLRSFYPFPDGSMRDCKIFSFISKS